ncbi:hypothetical protein [Gemmata sp. SH-PL17]|nr:hypothetical protein [Gemmata sp. SH-PL17]
MIRPPDNLKLIRDYRWTRLTRLKADRFVNKNGLGTTARSGRRV